MNNDNNARVDAPAGGKASRPVRPKMITVLVAVLVLVAALLTIGLISTVAMVTANPAYLTNAYLWGFMLIRLGMLVLLCFTIKTSLYPRPIGRWLAATVVALGAAMLAFNRLTGSPASARRFVYDDPMIGSLLETLLGLAMVLALLAWAGRILLSDKYTTYYERE